MRHTKLLELEQSPMCDEEEENDEMTVTGTCHEESSPKLFKLTIDCFDEIFEYISMKDLHSLGQTCKAMQKVAGEYFKHNYSAAEKFCAKDGIYTRYSNIDGEINERIQTSCFNQFMPCISHYYGVLKPIRYLQAHVNELASTNQIYLVSLFINNEKVELIKEILPQIETIQLRNCSMSRNFYELMLKYCENLKCIYLQNADSSYNGKHEWLLEEYPMLEHLELMPSYPILVDELTEFFTKNTKIQRFSTNPRFLWINRYQFLKLNIKLEILEIKAEYFSEFDDTGNQILLWDLLNQLHEQGFYKRLFIFTDCMDHNLSIKFNLVSASLETLCIRRIEECHSLPALTNLKELIILKGTNFIDMNILANRFGKLQRLYVDKATIEDILPFIRHSARLHKLKLFLKENNEIGNDDNNEEYENNPAYKFWYYESDHEKNKNEINGNRIEGKCPFNVNILDLVALNKEREKLREKIPTTRKVAIYVRDDVFLATKWATKNGDTNLSLIEMRRSDSYEWNPHF